MSKHTPLRSFHDLDATQFCKAGDVPKSDLPAGKRAASLSAAPVPPDFADEEAMFLEAVAGTLDVSLKHTPAATDTPALRAREEKPSPSVLPTGLGNPLSRPQSKAAAGPELPESETDADLFAEAVDGVRPLDAGGRDLTPPRRRLTPSHTGTTAGMDAVFTGKLTFSLEYTDEFAEGHVLGLDPLVLAKLKAGAYSPEGHVDLHGQNMEQAYATLVAFIRHAYQSGKRHLVVVTGRGKNSPGGIPILRERVQTWLTRDPFKRAVLGFCSAKPGDGGVGALYVLLRKRKKSQGKIIWNHTPSEEELLL